MEDLVVSAAEAAAYLDAGTVGVADILCRRALEQNPRDGAAWAVLARIAGAIGERAAAERYAAEAVRRGAAALTVNAAEAPAPASGERYLLIKAWGNGFCSDLDHTLGHLLLAEMTGRTPVIHWGANSLFGRAPEVDAFGEFFEPVSQVGAAELAGKGYDFFPPKWNDANLFEENKHKLAGPWSRLPGLSYLNRPERVAVADYHAGVVALLPWVRPGHWLHGLDVATATRRLVQKYLRLRPEIVAEVEEFALQRFVTRPVIAAHIRGSDKEKEDPQLAEKIAVYPRAIRHLAQGQWVWSVFLLTDSEPVRARFAGEFAPNLVTTDCTRTETQTGLHLQGLPDRVKLGREVARDAWLAARCDRFVGMGSSNVSCLIYHLREWPQGSTIMLGPLMTHLANPYLYMNHDQLARYLPAEMIAKLRKRAEETGG